MVDHWLSVPYHTSNVYNSVDILIWFRQSVFGSFMIRILVLLLVRMLLLLGVIAIHSVIGNAWPLFDAHRLLSLIEQPDLVGAFIGQLRKNPLLESDCQKITQLHMAHELLEIKVFDFRKQNYMREKKLKINSNKDSDGSQRSISIKSEPTVKRSIIIRPHEWIYRHFVLYNSTLHKQQT